MLQTSWTRRFALAAVFGALTAAFGAVQPRTWASAGDDDAAATAAIAALKSLQGMWIIEENGSIQTVWTIKDDTITARVDGVEYGGKLTVDPKAEPHSTIAVEIQKGPEDAKGQKVKGIYKLDGSTLTVNVANPGVDLPTDFKAVDGQTRVFELTKVKGSK